MGCVTTIRAAAAQIKGLHSANIRLREQKSIRALFVQLSTVSFRASWRTIDNIGQLWRNFCPFALRMDDICPKDRRDDDLFS